MINKTITDFFNAINATPRLQPKIYMACLASHSKGETHGVWVKANQSVKVLKKAAQRMLATSPAGKEAMHWTILKTEGFEPLVIDAFTSLAVLSRLAAFLTKQGELGAILMSHFNDDLSLANLEKADYLMRHCYHGVHTSQLAFTESFFPSIRSLPLCIDTYKLMTSHLFRLHFFTLKIRNQLHVFRHYETLGRFRNSPLN